MAEKRNPFTDASSGYRAVGIVFLVAAVAFVFTDNTAMWVSMFTLGIVFLTLSATTGRAPAEDAASSDTDAPSDRPEE